MNRKKCRHTQMSVGGKSFRIINVKGDGSCFYRCIWRIARSDGDVARVLLIDNLEDEDDGTEEVRYVVALTLKYEKYAQMMLSDLIEVYKAAPFIIENYPILKHVDCDGSLVANCKSVADVIENTKIMASSFELDVIRGCLSEAACDIGLIVLVRDDTLELEDLAEKLLKELHIALGKCKNERVTVIINEENIHYKYTKILGEIVNSRDKLVAWTQDLMEEEDEEDVE